MTRPAKNALDAIEQIDDLAELIGTMLYADPMQAARALGQLRAKLTFLRCDVRTLSELYDMQRGWLGHDVEPPPPHPADTEPLIPVTNLELSVEEAVQRDFEEAEYHMRRDDEMIEEDGVMMWQ